MPSTLVNRVKDTATTISGTGPYTLANAPPTGFRSFGAALGASGQTLYKADDGAGNWETIKGTYTDSTKTLTRDIFLDSSTGAPISWSAATPTVEIVAPSEWLSNTAHPGFSRSRWYSLLATASASLSNYALFNSQLSVTPIYVPDVCTITAIACYCGSAAGGGNIRMGLYSAIDGIPTELLVDGGSQAIAAGANAVTMSVPVGPGYVFAAICASANSNTLAGFTGGEALTAGLYGYSSASDTAAYTSLMSAGFSFGALPATFPSLTYQTAYNTYRLAIQVT